MTFLTALGGLSQGISQGISDLNEQKRQKAIEEQQAFQKTQNDRLLAQQAEEDRVANEIRGIQRTTPTGKEFYDEGSGISANAQVARPQHEVMSEMAAKYLASPDIKHQQYGLQLQQNASALGKEAERNAILAEHKSQFEQLQKDPFAWGDTHGTSYYNGKVPDGQKLTQSEVLPNGNRVYHVLDKNNKVIESHMVTPEQAREVAARALDTQIRHKLGTVSNEDYWKAHTGKLEERKAAAQETTAKAAETNAETQRQYHMPGGVYQQVAQAANKAHLEAEKIRASTHGIMNKLQEAQLKELTSFADLADKFQQQLDNPNTPKKELEKTANQLAVHPSGKALNTVLVRDAETGETKPITVNKFEHLTDIHQKGKAPEAALSAIQSGKLIDPKTKKPRPITLSDVEEFNRMFPNSPVDPSTLPYLKTK